MKKLLINLTLLAFLLLSCNGLWAQCTITLQPGPEGKDAALFHMDCASSPFGTGYCDTFNTGNSISLHNIVWTWGGTFGTMSNLMEFDLDTIIPSGCAVSSAVLHLYSEGDPGQYHCGTNSTIHPCRSNDFTLYRVTQAWDEMAVTWANQPPYASSTTGQDKILVPNEDAPYTNYTIDMTTMVNYWVTNPSQNHGILMKMNDETQKYRSAKFASSDHTNPTLRPKLVLTFTGCANACNNLVQGSIFDDQNGDCIQNGSDQPLENWLVKIEPGPTYASTNSSGKYEATLQAGTYTITQQLPNSYLWDSLCPLPYQHTITVSGTDTIQADFGVEADHYCPVLTVDVAAPPLRTCHPRNVIVSYCNNGNQTANNAYIEVNFPPALAVQSSNMPYTNVGTKYTFQVGNLSPGVCGSFYVQVVVDCNSNIGDVECIEAAILPLYNCAQPIDTVSSTTWDKSSIQVTGYCNNDSMACFIIRNTGSATNGNMQGPSLYRIYVNNVLTTQGFIQLSGGDSTIICWANNGNSVRLEADQRPGHPGNSHPNDVVENCGPNASLVNYFAELPEDDAEPNIAIECAEVVNSWDPNDKQVTPSGVGAAHYIAENTALEYKIRFQNTGNDTAYHVVVRDTLTTWVDIESIQLGAVSHNYSFRVYGNRILEWRFDNIMLVDSNANEPLSHGFLKFKVNQLVDNPIGTVIENNAGIYFDYNEPVITNTAFVTIGDMQTILLGEKDIEQDQPKFFQVNVYPNPFSVSTTVEINGYNGNEPIIFELYNLLGERVQTIKSTQSTFQVEKRKLVSGVYIYRAQAANQLLGTGKLIVD